MYTHRETVNSVLESLFYQYTAEQACLKRTSSESDK